MESEKEKADILKDEDVTAFIRKNKATNTITKTASAMRIWKQWCESVGKRHNVEDIPSTELDRLLSHFFVKVCKKNGEEYEPLSLISYQRSINRYQHEEKRQTRSVLKDPEFEGSRAALTAKRKDLRRKAKCCTAVNKSWRRRILGDRTAGGALTSITNSNNLVAQHYTPT